MNNIQEGLSGQDGILRNLTKNGASQLGFSERTGSIAFSVLDAGTSIAALTRKVPKLGRVVLDSGFRTKPIRLFRGIPSDFQPALRQLTQFAIFRELSLTAIGVGGSFQDSGTSE